MPLPPIKKERRPKNICKISFDLKCIEKINLLAISMTHCLKHLFQTYLLILIFPLCSILVNLLKTLV